MPTHRSGPLVWMAIILVTCLLLMLAQSLLWLIVPGVLGTVFYYITEPAVSLAVRHGLSRSQAVFLVVLGLTLLLSAVVLFTTTRLYRASGEWRQSIQRYADGGSHLVLTTQESVAKVAPFLFPNPTHPSTDVLERKLTNWISSHSADIVVELLHWIPSLLLVPYFTYFFLLDGPRFKRFLVQAIPNAFFEKTLDLFYRVDNQVRRYFLGLLSLTAIDALCLGVGLWWVGLAAPFSMALLAAVLSWIPYLGSIVGCLLVVLVSAGDAPDNSFIPYEAVAVFIIVRLLDDFVFMPMTIGRSLQLHPLITIVMILLGGAVAGIAGLLLVMPVFGVVMVIGQMIGALLNDERILARYFHSMSLRWKRARADLGPISDKKVEGSRS